MHFQDCPLHAVLDSSFTDNCPQAPAYSYGPQRR